MLININFKRTVTVPYFRQLLVLIIGQSCCFTFWFYSEVGEKYMISPPMGNSHDSKQDFFKFMFFIKKFILNILYYKFIEKSRFFLKRRFSRFGTPKIRKIKKKILWKNTIKNTGEKYIIHFMGLPEVFSV